MCNEGFFGPDCGRERGRSALVVAENICYNLDEPEDIEVKGEFFRESEELRCVYYTTTNGMPAVSSAHVVFFTRFE